MATRRAAVVLLLAAASALPVAQTLLRRATTVEAIRAYPTFYNGQAVVVAGRVARDGDRLRLVTDGGSLHLLSQEPLAEGDAALRGQVFDLGRMNQDDPRLTAIDTTGSLTRLFTDRWPRPGEEMLLSVTSSGPLPASVSLASPPIRALALQPERFTGEAVSVVGQFRGRNLYADLPAAPTDGRWDFVLRSADAALWVTGVRPRGKDFDLDPGRRVDTGRWVRVTGTVHAGRGLVWLDGTSIATATEPDDAEAVEVEVPAPPTPPLEVFFSAPTAGEADVRLDSTIRIQFSRDLAPDTLEGHIRLTYSSAQSTERGEPQAPAIPFSVRYQAATRSLEIVPDQPLERFRDVRVDLLEGIRGPTGQALAPFTLSFSTGGS
ncbi:MAG: Ig-like domain-containing protein [Vicinamibacterales bacterium]